MNDVIIDLISSSVSIEPRANKEIDVRLTMNPSQICDMLDEIPLSEIIKYLGQVTDITKIVCKHLIEPEDVFEHIGPTEIKHRVAQWLIDQG